MIKLDATAGSYIGTVCEKAAKLAKQKNDTVEFEFNSVIVTAYPGDGAEGLHQRWDRDFTVKQKQSEINRTLDRKSQIAMILNEVYRAGNSGHIFDLMARAEQIFNLWGHV